MTWQKGIYHLGLQLGGLGVVLSLVFVLQCWVLNLGPQVGKHSTKKLWHALLLGLVPSVLETGSYYGVLTDLTLAPLPQPESRLYLALLLTFLTFK